MPRVPPDWIATVVAVCRFHNLTVQQLTFYSQTDGCIIVFLFLIISSFSSTHAHDCCTVKAFLFISFSLFSTYDNNNDNFSSSEHREFRHAQTFQLPTDQRRFCTHVPRPVTFHRKVDKVRRRCQLCVVVIVNFTSARLPVCTRRIVSACQLLLLRITTFEHCNRR